MPLVVPGINSADGSKTEEWTNKLVGKKLGDSSDATVYSTMEVTVSEIDISYRHLPRQTSRRRLVSLSQDRW